MGLSITRIIFWRKLNKIKTDHVYEETFDILWSLNAYYASIIFCKSKDSYEF